ncbi:MAG: kelch repeat-containing protein [Dehalococcoidia bacterium]
MTAGSWSALTPGGTAPAPRFGHNAVWDPVGGRMLLFSGQPGRPSSAMSWSYDPDANAWTKIADEGAGPQRRYGGGGHYDAGAKALYISHGFTNQGRFDDTWAFGLENEAWRDQSPGGGERPERRCLLRTGADPTRGRMLLFGGQSNSAAWLGDTWLLDLGARAWRRLDGPGPRRRASLFAHGARRPAAPAAVRRRGGRRHGRPVAVRPERRYLDRAHAAGRYAVRPQQPRRRGLPGRAAMLLFGGRGGGSHRNDLWEVSFA